MLESAIALRARIFLAALASQRSRALVAGGMVSLGVASTLIMVALGTGVRLEVQALQESTGRNLFYVRAGQRPLTAGRGEGRYVSTRLEPEEATLIEQHVPAVGRAVPIREQGGQVKLGSKRVVTTVRGVTPGFFTMRKFEVAEGRALVDSDSENLRRVAVVGPFVRKRLTGEESLLGATVRVAGVPFEIVGELRERGTGSDGSDQDDQVLVPFETAIRRLENVEHASMLLIQAREEFRMREAIDGVRDLLRATHYIQPGAREDFDILETIQQNIARQTSSQWLQGLARILAGVTLLLGGAGVFAVTWLNAGERAGEIGLRMAIGATRTSVAALFVAEGVVLSALGGAAGLVIGVIGAEGLERATSWSLPVDLRGIAIPLASATAIGLLCSLLPALRASRVMPAVALAGGA